MFFPERIKSIQPTDYVLEIGPGAFPHSRADVFLDLYFHDSQEAYEQSGFSQAAKLDRPLIYYDGGTFPFKDNAFDYIICSHVIEHVPREYLEKFITELQRIAKRGYLEFPNIFYELINYQDVHLWLMNYREGKILFLDKVLFRSNYIHQIYREMFYGNDKHMYTTFQRHKDFYFCGFEWENHIPFVIVSDYDELINQDDYKIWREYFKNFQPTTPVVTSSPAGNLYVLKQIIKTGMQWVKKLKYFISRQLTRRHQLYFIHKTAQLEKRELVIIKEHAQIKDYVIIRTHSNPVTIGRNTQLNPFVVIYGGSGVYIGDNVMIAPNCVIAAGDHNYKQVDTPMMFAGSISKGPIIIEDNVWIGANCTITDGVRIGKDAVIAANCVVTEDVAPFDIVGGVPGRVIGNRKSFK